MAGVRFAALQSRPMAFLDCTSVTLDAFQALQTLKADPRFQDVPTLAFANHEEVDTWNRAKALGVTKIVSRNEFSARMSDLFEEVAGVRS